ncbi:unnamed protein product [Lota lota]
MATQSRIWRFIPFRLHQRSARGLISPGPPAPQVRLCRSQAGSRSLGLVFSGYVADRLAWGGGRALTQRRDPFQASFLFSSFTRSDRLTEGGSPQAPDVRAYASKHGSVTAAGSSLMDIKLPG